MNKNIEIYEDVNSSRIDRMEYNKKDHTLDVTFNRGRVYRYSDVPLSTWEALKNETDSVGKLFQKLVMDTKLSYTRIS